MTWVCCAFSIVFSHSDFGCIVPPPISLHKKGVFEYTVCLWWIHSKLCCFRSPADAFPSGCSCDEVVRGEGDAWDAMRCEEMQCTSRDTRCTLRDLQLHFGETKSLICILHNIAKKYSTNKNVVGQRMPGYAWRVNFSSWKLAGSQTKLDSTWGRVHVFVIVCVSRKVAWLWGANTVRARPGHRLH